MEAAIMFGVTFFGAILGGVLAWLGLIAFERFKYGKHGQQ